MAYTTRNFRTKKELREAVAARAAFRDPARVVAGSRERYPAPVTCYNPGLGGELPATGKVYLEGPHAPEPHRWYAEAWLENGEVVRVR